MASHKEGQFSLSVRFSLKEKHFMKRGVLPSCASLFVTILSLHSSAFSTAAQEPAQMQQGVITTFAPIVEKVAPSVVTVFTTQTVSRGQTELQFSDDALRQFFGDQTPQ